MTETATMEKVQLETDVQEAPTANLPAVHQEKPPRRPAQRKATQYPARIASAILKVSGEIGAIQKEGYNQFQRYKYTRWEDINEKIAPLLVKHGLVIVQSEQSRSLLEENDKGSVLAIVYHFTIVNESGDAWGPMEWTGIARLRDAKGVTDDKAATKCHTQAEKFFCVKQFKIVTDDLDKADQQDSLPKKNAGDIYKKLETEIDTATSVVELGTWGEKNAERIQVLPRDWQNILRGRFKEKLAELQNSTEQVIWDEETGEISSGN